MSVNSSTRYGAECIGTFLLVFLGAGSAVISGDMLNILGVSLSFGFTLTLLASCLGPISGAHFNPAVTLALGYCGRLCKKHIIGYILSQIAGAVLAGIILYCVASGKADFSIQKGFALNGYELCSPSGYAMFACFLIELIATTVLCYVVIATTRPYFPPHLKSLIVGLTLTVLLFVSIPITNGSINVARSIGVAVIHGGEAIKQLWLFALAHSLSVVLSVRLAQLTLPDRLIDMK